MPREAQMKISVTWNLEKSGKHAVEVIGEIALQHNYTFSKATEIPVKDSPIQYIQFEAPAFDEVVLATILKIGQVLELNQLEAYVSIDVDSNGKFVGLLQYATMVSKENSELVERYATMETFLKEVQGKLSTGKAWLDEEKAAFRAFVDTSLEKFLQKGIKGLFGRNNKSS
jgi:uncharacterized protein YuzE